MELTKDQIAKRLAYLWYMRENNPQQYMDDELNKEKYEIYASYGPDNEVASKAHEYYYETFGEDFNKVINEGSCYSFE